jgi:hypothetical protein
VVPEDPDIVIDRPEGTQSVWQNVPNADGPRFLVHATTTCFAKNEDHARRKLIDRLSGGSERVTWSAEQLGDPSGYATARDVSVFKRASFVRG